MARSAEVQQEEKKKRPELLTQLNEIIDLAVSQGRKFSVNDLRKFEERGKAVRVEHENLKMRPTPVAQKVSGAVPTREVQMARPAVVAALKLAETFELAGSSRALNIRAWIEAGRLA
jgi:hypothetical protein